MRQTKLIIILILIVSLPLILLAWQGWKINKDEQQLNTARFDSLVSARLDQVDTLVQSYFDEMRLKWNLLIPRWDLDNEALRQRIDNDGSIRQVFVIDAQRIRRFPPIGNEITKAEKTFVERLAVIWRDPQMLFSNQSSNENIERRDVIKKKSSDYIAQSSRVGSRIKKSTRSDINSYLDNTSSQGWYMWHWGTDSNLIFWRQNKEKNIVGIELEPVRVKADLISRLPDTEPDGSSDDFRLRLLDTAGHVVYQWGSYLNAPVESVRQKRNLSYPLSSWSLEYYGKPFNQSGMSRYSLLLTFAGFGLLISGLAWFLYREQTREMRLASQRVQFVSQVSHELKTPLTNIRMYAEMLQDQVDGHGEPEPQQKRYLQVITDESQRLSRLIANVLNFARKPRIHKRDFEPDDVIQQVIDHFKPGLESRGVKLGISLSANSTIFSDPDNFEQILNNLLSNAEKYAAGGKLLEVNSKIEDRKLIVQVRDYGKGIARSERKRIFQPFYRINDDLTEGVSGTGIGLTIARQQAEHLGGTLELVDVTPGACFQLSLHIMENNQNKA